MTFNSEQETIFEVARTTTANMMVEALPGTGKSTVLVELLRHVKGSVFLCAFGKKAVEHLSAKAVPIVGDGLLGRDPRVTIQTTHSLGFRTWMRAQGFGKIKLESNKVRILARELAKSYPLAAKYNAIICKLVKYAKGAGLGVLSSIDNHSNWQALVDKHSLEGEFVLYDNTIADIFQVCIRLYHESLKQCVHTVDFEDQILAPLYYDARFVKYDNVLVDEAQDTSPLRLHMLMKMPKARGRMICVGDSNQACMVFSGASVESMTELKEMTEALVYPLHTSYRLPRSGAAFASQFAPGLTAAPGAIEGVHREVNMAPSTIPKDYWGPLGVNVPHNYIDVTCSDDKQQHGIPAIRSDYDTFWDCAPFTADDAVLCRSTRPLVELAYQLIRRQIPCRVEGRNIGEGLIHFIGKWRGVYSLDDLAAKVCDYRRTESSRLLNAMKDVEAEGIMDRCDTVLALIDATYEMYVDMGEPTTSNLVGLIETIFGDTPEGEAPSMCVLSTVHKAKGREWPRVFVLGYNQYMPSKYAKKPWELREERNLQFIAITRHMRELVLVNMPEVTSKSKRRRSNHEFIDK